jgi:hypothetical protein
MTSPASIRCEISARRPAQVGTLAEIARICADDLGQTLTIESGPAIRPDAPTLVTLHLPAALASSQHEVWCLACRLACFCPDARISVMVSASHLFAPATSTARSA